MKKLFFSGLAVVLFVAMLGSCKKTAQSLAPSFDANLSDLTFDLPRMDSTLIANGIPPSALDSNTLFPLPFDFHQHLDLDSLVRANTSGSLGIADVKSVKIKTMEMEVRNPNDSNNLGNFKFMSLQFHSNTLATPLEVLSYDFPYGRTDSISYSPTVTPELRPYLDGNELYYNISGKIRKATSKNLKLQIKAVVTVK